MEKKIRAVDLPEFDLTKYLQTDEDITARITLVIEDGDPAELSHALSVAAKGQRHGERQGLTAKKR